MPLLLSSDVAHRSISDGASPQITPVLVAVTVGATVFVLVGDGYGYINTVTSVTDSARNVYTLDSDVNEADGDGSVFIARSTLTTALTLADTISVAFSGGNWPSAYIQAVAFTGVSLDNAGTPVGSYGPASLSPDVVATAGDLVLGFACYQHGPVTDDPAWTEVQDTGDASNHLLVAYRIATATGSIVYHTSTAGAGGYSAAVACSYVPTAAPATPPSIISAGSGITGIVGS